jgi:hypothetical protein
MTMSADTCTNRPRPRPGATLAADAGRLSPGGIAHSSGAAMARIVFMDCETVSLTPGPATIWELALIIRTEHGDEEYLWQIRPDLTTANPISLAIGGYYKRCLISSYAPGSVKTIAVPDDECGDPIASQRAHELAAQLAPLLSGAHIIAANPGFDTDHVAAFLRANGECPAWDYHLTDISSLVRGHAAARENWLPFPLKVTDAATAAGIDPSVYNAHTALGDTRLVRDIFDAVTAGMTALRTQPKRGDHDR